MKDLDVQTVAFPSPNALGASLLMRAELAREHDTHVNAKYVKTHSSVYLHVAKGLLPAGGGVVRTLSEQPSYIQDALRVLYTTTEVNAHPIVVHPKIGQEFKRQIQGALVKMADEKPDIFDAIPMKGPVPSSYDDYTDLETLGLDAFAVHAH